MGGCGVLPDGSFEHAGNCECFEILNPPDTQPVEYTNEHGLPVPITTEDETSMTAVTSMERNLIER
jgi:hypothetical protein